MGKTPDRGDDRCWGKGHKWVSIRDISNFGKYINDTKEQITDYGVLRSGIKLIPKHTIIMSFKLSIGKVSITTEPIYTNEAIMAFIDRGIMQLNNNYLFALFTMKNWFNGSNTAVMGKTLNKSTLAEKTIPVPNIYMQNQFSDFVSQIDKSKFAIQKSLEKTQQLFDSLMQEYFG